jgi:NhaP-type Na+/H+ or K+/H+ antiporter
VFDFSQYHIMYALIGASIITAHWLPRFFSEREPATSALLIGAGAVTFGLMPGMPVEISPLAAPLLWERASEICVIFGLFGVGMRIDRLAGWAQWRPTTRLLLIAMPLTIAAIAWLGWALGGMTMAGALLLGAVLAPTDPVLASDVQVGPPGKGREHPVRFILTTEAGLNDGGAFPFIYLGIALASAGALSFDLGFQWLWRDLIYRIIVGTVMGLALAKLMGKVLFNWPSGNPLANTGSAVVALASVLLIYGITELAEGYGFVAAFVSGLVLRRAEVGHKFHTNLHDFAETIERALTAFLLIALGASLPAILPALNWTDAGIALALIFVIRPLLGWFSLTGSSLKGYQRFVVSFYGVRGIGSIYYLSYIIGHIELVNKQQLWAIVAFTIIVSAVVHGFTAGLAVERATGVKHG